jgi:hypothetical protein
VREIKGEKPLLQLVAAEGLRDRTAVNTWISLPVFYPIAARYILK